VASSRRRYGRELALLREAYLRELPGKVAALRREALKAWGPRESRAQGIEALYQAAHRLAGSAAVFGLVEVSEAARDLEARLGEAPGRATTAAQLRREVEAVIARVEAAASVRGR
jgi:HPt (histidine-containing phosphotransfer) domain-containing protein